MPSLLRIIPALCGVCLTAGALVVAQAPEPRKREAGRR